MPTLLRFLEFCEDCHQNNFTSSSVPLVQSQSEPEIVALRYLQRDPEEKVYVQDLASLLILMFTRVLRLDGRLQSRAFCFELFAVLCSSWPSLPITPFYIL